MRMTSDSSAVRHIISTVERHMETGLMSLTTSDLSQMFWLFLLLRSLSACGNAFSFGVAVPMIGDLYQSAITHFETAKK